MMMPKLYSVETMLGFYLKVYACGQAELALGEPWLYIPGYTLPLQCLNTLLVVAQRNEAIFIHAQEYIQHRRVNNEYQPRTPLVLECIPTSAGTSYLPARSQPNYFRRSQVELDLVYPATTSPNPDSTSARRIEIHFNFNLELNYSKLKLDVPGTRLITSQVMLNYHTNRRVGDLEVKVGAF
ncbi:hypothetical protein B0H14DRAFT_2565766 [Mycena olivaceomarginata]|nr:hypothetical protein B0H14DRAFT_2565766 [Mycena olivaceomarginata]